jgi:putative heme-binding domain-containing protein
VETLRAQVQDRGAGDEARVAAARRLVVLDDGDATVATITGALDSSGSPAFSSAAIDVLGASTAPSVAAQLLARFKDLRPAARAAAVDVLLRRPDWTKALLAAVGAGTVAPFAIPLTGWHALARHPDAALAELSERVRGQRGGERRDVLAELMPLADRDGGDAARGRELFAHNCAACHRAGGQGGVIGPDLEGIGARPRRDTLLAILDPNASVESNYVMWVVTLEDGATLAGRLDAETRTTIELLDLTGKRHVLQRDRVKTMQSVDASLMPAGFESLGEQGLLDLLAFLSEQHPGR